MERLVAAAAPPVPPSADGSGVRELAGSLASWTALWLALFYALSVGRPMWAGRLEPSTKAHENCRYWEARNVLGIIHAALVSAIAVPAVLAFASVPEEVRFASSDHVATCAQSSHPEVNVSGQAVALGGLVFSSFIAADLFILAVHRLASPDFIVHHAAFLTAGLIIRGNCMLPFNAAVLLAMEASTPFLNLMLLLRNRGPSYSTAVRVTGVLFFLSYVLFRLMLNTLGAMLLWQRCSTAMPATVPLWQRTFLLLAVTAGSVLQFFWFPAIAKIFCSGLMQLVTGQSATGASGSSSPVSPSSLDAPSDFVQSRGHEGRPSPVTTTLLMRRSTLKPR